MKNNWPIKKLGEIAFVDWGNTSITKKSYLPKGFPAFSATGCDGFMESFEHDMDAVILSAIGARCGKTFFASGKWTAIKNTIIIYAKDEKVILNKFIFDYLDPAKWPVSGAGQPFITIGNAKKIEIPVPPLDIQKKIVERLDSIKKAQELNDLQISKTDELFESSLFKMFSEKEAVVELRSVCKFVGGGTPSKKKEEYFVGDIPWITVKDIPPAEIFDSRDHVNAEAIRKSAANLVPENTVLVVTRVGLGKIGITKTACCFNQDIKALIPTVEIDPYYLYFSMVDAKEKIISQGAGATVKGITLSTLGDIKIPVPPLSEQQKIVTKLNAIQDHKKLLLKQKELLQELFDSVLYKSMNGEMDE